jgi:DNA adenine methylase
MSIATTPVRPRAFLRWAGSKRQLLPLIRRYWRPSFQRYIEPFCGSASLYFDLLPAQASLSDINEDLVDTLRAVQLWPDTVSECLARLPTDKASYYAVRAQSPSNLAPTARAARFIYLNLLCFNGLYRVNRNGHFNVPYGAKQRQVLVTQLDMRAISRALLSADLFARDFEYAIEEAGEGDFLYLDPPYATANTRVFTEYDVASFTPQDIDRLHAALRAAADRGAKFVLSYADVPEMQALASGWSLERVRTRRNISGFTGSRRYVDEVLISNCETLQ